MREFPRKGRKRSELNVLFTKLRETETSKGRRTIIAVERGLCVTSGAPAGNQVCMLVKGAHFEHRCDANCTKNSVDLDCLKMFVKFYFLQRNDVINFDADFLL